MVNGVFKSLQSYTCHNNNDQVKVDAKTNTLLEEYKSKKNKTGTSRQTEFEKMKDGEVLAAIRSVMREHQEELNKAVVEEPAELSAATSTATTSTLNVAKELQDKNDKKVTKYCLFNFFFHFVLTSDYKISILSTFLFELKNRFLTNHLNKSKSHNFNITQYT